MTLGRSLGLQFFEFDAEQLRTAHRQRWAFHATSSLMQVLQAVYRHFVQMVQSIAGCARRQRRVVRDAPVHRLAPDGHGLADGLLAFGCVHDECDLIVLDHVHNMRPALANLIDPAAFNPRGMQRVGGAVGRRPFRSRAQSVVLPSV